MQYRKLPKGTEQISVIGIGTGSIQASSEKEIEKIITTAIENGINYFDMASAEAKPFDACGRALKGMRDKAYFQIHFGTNYEKGMYGWTTDLDIIKRSVDRQMKAMQIDYIDFGFLHCIDEPEDLHQVEKSGVIRYIEELKKTGVVRHMGLSSHTPLLANEVLDMGILDMLMFSINPVYDYAGGSEANYAADSYAIGGVAERMNLYRRCESEGVGISVMKAFCGGQLLKVKTSPFGKSLTQYQCIQYALDKPGVLTVLPGIRTMDDLKHLLGFLDAGPEARDYSLLGSFAPQAAAGKCVYCNHCQPCPMGLDVGLINKYYDLSKAGDVLAKSHYENLAVKADACVGCMHCNKRCPFHVDQVARMQEILAYFLC
ncbi:MAG: aldo/keto reductase [Lachnospiraceae bacterium]|nr:aldo/keto reductase [Lachnospiraceae bacterium]